MAKKQLYGPDGVVAVRSAVAASDAGTWTPEDVAAGSRDDVILDGEQWDDVRVIARFSSPHANDAVTIQSLISVPITAAPGREWVAIEAASVLGAPAHHKNLLARTDGHNVAFRVTGLTIGAGGAESLELVATGGRRKLRAGA